MYRNLFGVGGRIASKIINKISSYNKVIKPKPSKPITNNKPVIKPEPTPIKPKPVQQQVTHKENFLIISNPSTSLENINKWASSKNTSFKQVVPIAYRTSVKYGIDPVLTIAQIALETGYCTYTGQVPSYYYNTCGLKTKDGKSFHKFKSWDEGVEAHVQHLALYANSSKLVGKEIVDPRHFEWLRGTAKSANDLANKWACNSEYGVKLNKLCNEIIKNH